MCTRKFFLLGFTVLPLLLASCSGTAPGRYPVRGKVTYKGQPATGASVHFRREGETPDEAANFPIGAVDSEGNFELKAEGLGYGALPGKYKVLILWSEEPNREASDGSASGKSKKARGPVVPVGELRRDPKSVTDRLKFRYFNLQNPLLAAEVRPGTNQLDPFDLKD
jgi:hypothetical protein